MAFYVTYTHSHKTNVPFYINVHINFKSFLEKIKFLNKQKLSRIIM